MTYSQIKCIDESLLDAQIRFLEHQKELNPDDYSIQFKLEYIINMKQDLTSATPILEKAFKAGHKSSKMNSYKSNGTFEQDFEQFLNTEVNI